VAEEDARLAHHPLRVRLEAVARGFLGARPDDVTYDDDDHSLSFLRGGAQ
jgi:hypothetical protein